MKIRSSFVTLIICLTVINTGCGYFSSKPSDVITSYVRHMEREEVEEAAKLFSETYVKNHGGLQEVKRELSYITRELKARGGVKTFEVVKEETFGELAEVTAKVAINNVPEKEHTYKLIKEDGAWKMEN